MMDLISGIPVTLVVKAPNEKIADQTVECPLDWTIKELKLHLADVYPNRPTELQQRIIYSGKLLQDHLVLKDVLKKFEENQTTHTVHLVCSSNGEKQKTQGSPHRPITLASSQSPPPMPEVSAPSPPAPSVMEAAPPAGTEGLRHRHVPSNSHPGQQYDQAVPESFQMADGGMYAAAAGQQMMYPGLNPMMQYTPEQMAWMQQMYAQQMMHYMQYYQHGYQSTSDPATAAVDTAPAEQAANQNEANAARPNQRAAGANQPIRMNAQGGAVVDDDDDEEGGNRDWLDWVYTLSRFMVLLSIVYFYSNFTRFIMVFSLSVIIYLYQGGWFALQRRRRGDEQQVEEQPAQEAAEGVQAQEQEQPQPQQPEDGANADQPEGSETSDAAASEPAQPQGPGPVAVAWSFVSTFFTSLVPDQPPPVNIN